MSLQNFIKKEISDIEEEIQNLSAGAGVGAGIASGSTSTVNARQAALPGGKCKGNNLPDADRRRRNLPSLPPRKPVVDPRPFDGSTSFKDFILNFSLCADINEWGEKEKVQYLTVMLRGEALQVYRDMPSIDCGNFNRIVKELEMRFNPPQHEDLYRAQLRSRVQREGETLVELAAEIRKLVNLGYPNTPPDIREEMGKEQFLVALNSPVLRLVVRRNKPKTLSEAVVSAVEEEVYQRMEGSRGGYSDRPKVVAFVDEKKNDYGQRLESLSEQVADLSAAVGQLRAELNKFMFHGNVHGMPKVGNPGCWECGDLQHFRRDCPRLLNGGHPREQQLPLN